LCREFVAKNRIEHGESWRNDAGGQSAFAFPSKFFQQLDLDLLNLEQTVVLSAQQMIDFFVQMPDLKLSL
jgi:hypothetical protein